LQFIRSGSILPQTLFMKKFFLAGLLFFIAAGAKAQIEVLKVTGKNSQDYKIGFGAFLKFAFPVSQAAYTNIEAGFNFAQEKEDAESGMAVVPLKIGYRYTLNGTGTGLYVEPQAGYNLYGVRSHYDDATYQEIDEKFHGIVGAIGIGYLFQPGNKIQFDLGAYYESIFHNGNRTSYIGLRLSHNISIGRRDEY
jgi:hypothetical protein